jgi:hypothetical protein
LYACASTSRVVPYQLNVRVLVQVWVGVELSYNQIFHLFRTRCKDVGQASDLRINCWQRLRRTAVRGCTIGQCLLAGDKCEMELEFVGV